MLGRVEETLFQILFVMTEAVGPPSSTAFLKTVLLFWLDLGQVLRVLASPKYGWSDATYDLIKHVDAIFVIADLIASVLPRYSLWIFAALLVSVAFADTAYAAKIFKGGEKIKTMWPVKLLKFLVVTVVTTLYSSVLKWLLIPIDCLVSKEESMSVALHGAGSPCQPWVFPDILFSAFSLVVAVVYIAFALCTSLLSFETNPLARGARASSTGRVEAYWIAFKCAQSFLMYFSVYVKPITCVSILFIMSMIQVYLHITILPFHNHGTNALRGGVYTCVSWLCLSAIFNSSGERNQSREWLLVSFIPVFFVFGMCLVHLYRRHLMGGLERLRIEYQISQQNLLQRRESAGGTVYNAPSSLGASQISPIKQMNGGGVATGQQTAMVEKFYDKTWEKRRAFATDKLALVTIRTLLFRRRKEDKDLVMYLVNQACHDHPESNSLKMFRLKLVRFLVCNLGEASMQMKRFKMERLALYIDHRYIVYSIQRKTSQESVGANLGKGTYSAINVMEFDAGMDRASKAHKECIRSLRKFWTCNKRAMRVTHPPDDSQVRGQVKEMMHALHDMHRSISIASQQYKTLLTLYPSSSALLHAYAEYCDCILYDQQQADHLRSQAESMDDDGEVDPDSDRESMGHGPGEDVIKISRSEEAASSAGSSMTEGFRGRMVKLLARHSEKILAADYASVGRLAFRVRSSLIIILLVATAGFVLTSKYLLSDMATANIESIDQTQKFGVYATLVMFNLRSMVIAARRDDEETVEHLREHNEQLMDTLRDQQRINYEAAHGPVKSFYLDPVLEWVVPQDYGLKREITNFWDLGNEFARRAQRASLATIEELKNESYVLNDISIEKRGIIFVFDNTINRLIPYTEKLLDLYEDEVISIAELTSMLVSVNAVVNSLLVLFISAIVLRALRSTIPRFQPHLVLCQLSLNLPRVLVGRLVTFYQKLEDQMAAVECEDIQMQQVLRGEDPPNTAMSSPFASVSRPLRDLLPPPTIASGVQWEEDTRGGEKSNGDGRINAIDADAIDRPIPPLAAKARELTTSALAMHLGSPETGVMGLEQQHSPNPEQFDRVSSWVGRERRRRSSVEEDTNVLLALQEAEAAAEAGRSRSRSPAQQEGRGGGEKPAYRQRDRKSVV